MMDIFGIGWEAELAYRRERIAADFRQAGGGRGWRRRPRTLGRERRPSFPQPHVRQAEVGGGGGHVRR